MSAPPRVLLVVATGLLFMSSVLCDVKAQDRSRGKTVQINGIDIYFESVGEGNPLLLLHGGTQTGQMFDPFVEQLSAHYRLIIPDLRGHGRSTNPSGEWSTRQFARDIFALLDHLGVERVKGIGASAGGMTLLHMATQQPARVEAMIVIGVGTYLPVDCRTKLTGTSADALPEVAWQRLREKHRHGDDQIRALYAWIDSLATSYNDMTFTPAYLSTITAQTLVVHGDRDYCFPASMAWDIYAAIPQAYLWVVPNGDHVPIRGPFAAPFATNALEFLGGAWAGN
jgi:pimeloyl-ACP methyl ester carboxylesterase